MPEVLQQKQTLREAYSRITALPTGALIAPERRQRPKMGGKLAEMLEGSEALIDTIARSTETRVKQTLSIEEQEAELRRRKLEGEIEDLAAERQERREREEERREEKLRERREQSQAGMFQMMQSMLERYAAGGTEDVRALRAEIQQMAERDRDRTLQALLAEAHGESERIAAELRELKDAMRHGDDPLEEVERSLKRAQQLRELFGVREAVDEGSGTQSLMVRARLRREEREFEERLDAEREERALQRREREAAMEDRFRRSDQVDALLERVTPVLEKLGERALPGGAERAALAAAQSERTPDMPLPRLPRNLPEGVQVFQCPQCGHEIPIATGYGQTTGVCMNCGAIASSLPPPEASTNGHSPAGPEYSAGEGAQEPPSVGGTFGGVD